MQETGLVCIAGERGGAEVVVEADAAILYKSRRTRMRSTGRPKRRSMWGAVEELNDARFAFRVLGRAEDAINGRPRGVQEMRRAFEESGIQRGPHTVHDVRMARLRFRGMGWEWRIHWRTVRSGTSSLETSHPPYRGSLVTVQQTE